MDLNKIAGISLLIVGSHVAVHELAIACRCFINTLQTGNAVDQSTGNSSLTDAINTVLALFAMNRITLDAGLKSAAKNNSSTTQFENLIRMCGLGIMFIGGLIITGYASPFKKTNTIDMLGS